MERLKSVIPDDMKDRIFASSVDDLHSTCSSLLSFFNNLPLFHQLVRDLTDPEVGLCGKNEEAARETKAKGNDCFAKEDYWSALSFYSQALRVAPIDAEEKDNNLVSTLFLNRSSALHKLGLFLESLRDCTRALILSPAYAKAWYRRAKANSSVHNSEEAIKDFNVSVKLEKSLTGRRQIESERNMLLEKLAASTSTFNTAHLRNSGDERLTTDVECSSTVTKGRGMFSSADIPLGSLVHKEDPYAAIILKRCRETHCSSCFNELAADTLSCLLCSIPLYCSQNCLVQAGGKDFPHFKKKVGSLQHLSDELRQHVRTVTSIGKFKSDSGIFAEHRHECGGMNWSAVLPSDVILAGRILMKHVERHNHHFNPKITNILDLCHSYGSLPSAKKLEFHVYSVILLHCLRQFNATNVPLDSAIVSEIVILLSQIRVNSMAVVLIRHSNEKEPLSYGATSSIEQVQVAQAVYTKGSLYNHSCQPNVHAYFFSRTIFIRATKNILAGSELELSYGPQVGQWDCSERQRLLADLYSFSCCCSGCSELNVSDLVLSGYHCHTPGCFGVVLDNRVVESEKRKLQHIPSNFQESMVNDARIARIAQLVLEQTPRSSCFVPEHCLCCGRFCDLQASKETIEKADINITRLQDSIVHGDITAIADAIRDAVKSLDCLRTMLHPLNKRIAEVEDLVARAFCMIGETQTAIQRSQASLEILETLYGEDHIAVGNELIKLASIQVAAADENAANRTSSRVAAILATHYGPHADIIFPGACLNS